MPRVHQLDEPRAVDMRVDLRRRDIGVAEQRLEYAQVRSARKQVCREGVTKHVRAHTLRANSGIGGHGPDDLEQADAAKVLFSARKQPDRPSGSDFQPSGNRRFGARGDWDKPILGSLAAYHHERLPGPHCAAGKANKLSRAKARPVEQFQQREISHCDQLAARGTMLCCLEHSLDLAALKDSRQRPL